MSGNSGAMVSGRPANAADARSVAESNQSWLPPVVLTLQRRKSIRQWACAGCLRQGAFHKKLDANAAYVSTARRESLWVITWVTCNACGFEPSELAADCKRQIIRLHPAIENNRGATTPPAALPPHCVQD